MTANTEDITVILACRNQGRFLHPAARSVAAAIERAESELAVEIEWITAGDNSSQATEEYLESRLPSRARKLLSKNISPAAAKNRAVEEAKGRYIALVSGDDQIGRAHV